MAKSRFPLAQSGVRACGAVILAVALAGCSSTGGVLGGMSGLSQAQPEGPAKAKQLVLISMPPITGGSDAYRQTAVRQLNQTATPRVRRQQQPDRLI